MDRLDKILTDLVPGIDLESESLIDDGVIDSFDMVALVSEIMDEFNIRISVEDIVPENFNSREAMMALIERVS